MYPGKHWALTKMEHDRRVSPSIHPALEHPSILAYMFETFVYPAKRLRYDGSEYILPEHGPDEPWFYETTESYSDRSSPSYTLMKDDAGSKQFEKAPLSTGSQSGGKKLMVGGWDE